MVWFFGHVVGAANSVKGGGAAEDSRWRWSTAAAAAAAAAAAGDATAAAPG